jgi:hypothetical protein
MIVIKWFRFKKKCTTNLDSIRNRLVVLLTAAGVLFAFVGNPGGDSVKNLLSGALK